MKDLDVRWIIESDVLDYTDRLVEHIRSNNIYYKETTYQEVLSHKYWDKYGFLSDAEVATVFVGSIRLAKEINRYPISPGAICTLKNFDCTNYYPSWSPYLLNNDWTITMKTLIERELNYLGEKNYQEFFFRPNEGDKRFTGVVSTRTQILQEITDNGLIIKAAKKYIGDEYRFLVVDRKVITGTRYLITQYGESEISIAQSYLEKVLGDGDLYIPDRAFTVDVGFNADTSKLGVIELNSFSCANLYSMDMNKVVPAINELAKQMYLEENE